MKIKIIFLFFIFYSFNCYSTNIRVVNLQQLIEQNDEMKQLLISIEKDQVKHKSNFRELESKLEEELKNIDNLKLILDNDALDNEINIYNQNLQNFNYEIKKFNDHYESQINNLKNIILKKIIEIIKKYSLDNQIDLILDSNSYILSSNSIDITEIMQEKLNTLNFDINFEKYK